MSAMADLFLASEEHKWEIGVICWIEAGGLLL